MNILPSLGQHLSEEPDWTVLVGYARLDAAAIRVPSFPENVLLARRLPYSQAAFRNARGRPS